MNENLKNLEQMLRENTGLKKRLDELCRKLAIFDEDAPDDEIFVHAVQDITGIELSTADLDQLKALKQTVDPEELESVTGGGGGPNIGTDEWCWADYACLITLKHNTDRINKNEVCLWDFLCVKAHYVEELTPPGLR